MPGGMVGNGKQFDRSAGAVTIFLVRQPQYCTKQGYTKNTETQTPLNLPGQDDKIEENMMSYARLQFILFDLGIINIKIRTRR